jgi:YVTN family beta-propeller protein
MVFAFLPIRERASAASAVATITLPGSTPTSAVVDSARNLIYVDEGYTDGIAISVISGQNNTVLDTIPIQNAYFAESMAFNPNNGNLYVPSNCTEAPSSTSVCSGLGEVSVIDTKTLKVIANITQNAPWGAALNPKTNVLYVVNGQSLQTGKYANSVVAINASNYDVIAANAVGFTSGGEAIAVNPTTNRIYVTQQDAGVIVINGSNDSVLTRITVGSTPSAVAVDANTNTIYVANYGSNSVSVINGTNNVVKATIPVGQSPYGIAVNPNTNRIYASNFGSGTVSIIDGLTNQVSSSSLTGADPYGLAADINNGLVYVPDAGPYPAQVSVISDTTSTTTTNGDSVTALVSPNSVSTGDAFTVSGIVTTGSGSVLGSEVHIAVESPNGTLVDSAAATVAGTTATGSYSAQFTSGGTPSWISGFYSVTATYSTLPGGTPATVKVSFSYFSAIPNTTPEVVQASSNELTTGDCSTSPCRISFPNDVFAGDTVIVGIGLECSSDCSSFTFSDSLGTSFRTITASTAINCSGQSGMLYALLSSGLAPQGGSDTVRLAWSGALQSVTSLDIMEASGAPYLISGINYGISGSPSLNGNLTGSQGDVFIGLLGFSNLSDGCNQAAGSSSGWRIWGGINTDGGLYDTALPSSNFPFPPFTVAQEDWVEIGAIFGTFTPSVPRTITVTSTVTSTTTTTSTFVSAHFITTTSSQTVTSTQNFTTTLTSVSTSTITATEVSVAPVSSISQTVAFALGALVVASISSLVALGLVLRRQAPRSA